MCRKMQSHCERDQESQEAKTEKVASPQSWHSSREPSISFHAHAWVNYYCVSEFLPPATKSNLGSASCNQEATGMASRISNRSSKKTWN